MYLVEIFLPLSDRRGVRFGMELYDAVRDELTDRFGGITSFGRSPARGTFKDDGGVVHDEIIVYEVMADDLDRSWWHAYRAELEGKFEQDEILIRASRIERL